MRSFTLLNTTLIGAESQAKMSTSSVSTVINNTKDPIGYRKKQLNPIGYSLLVDKLLKDYTDLIHPDYTKWFARRFYTLPFDIIHRCASEARADGKKPQQLFTYLIKKASTNLV